MTYQIDQSNKIEQTERDTVIAISNELKLTFILKRQDKRLLQKIFKIRGKKNFFPYITFAALLALLLKEVAPVEKVIIDREYIGYENLIHQHIIQYLKHLGFYRHLAIEFKQIGKTSPAHSLAAEVTVKGKRADRKVALAKLTGLIFSNKKDRESETDRGSLNFGLVTDDRRSSRSK